MGAGLPGGYRANAAGTRPSTSTPAPLTALALNCTLTPSPDASSTEIMADQVLEALGKHGVTGQSVRVVDLDVKPGVLKDMGAGDAWPGIRQQMLASDILVIATPTWLGHRSSVAQRHGRERASWNGSTRSSPRPTTRAG